MEALVVVWCVWPGRAGNKVQSITVATPDLASGHPLLLYHHPVPASQQHLTAELNILL